MLQHSCICIKMLKKQTIKLNKQRNTFFSQKHTREKDAWRSLETPHMIWDHNPVMASLMFSTKSTFQTNTVDMFSVSGLIVEPKEQARK